MRQLERLLFLQGHRCFFCQQSIPDGEASVEHLVASSNGGGNDDDNCIVCCKAVNVALGNLSVKAKLQAFLNQRGVFSCPRSQQTDVVSATTQARSHSGESRILEVVADLQKRGSARPRKLLTLRNTISAVFHKKLTKSEISALVATLASRGYIAVEETNVTYALPQKGA
jgi:hypothetical protein